MAYVAKIFVTLKRAVNDPQGITIRGGLHSLGFDSVEQVRVGKYMEVWVDEPSEQAAGAKVEAMCGQLLANPVIEDFRYELEAVSAVPGASA